MAARAYWSGQIRLALVLGAEAEDQHPGHTAEEGDGQADAEQRVSTAIEQAKQAADKARKAAAKFAMWLAASMLAGAVFAMLGATEGGVLRDSKWYEPGWRTTLTRTH